MQILVRCLCLQFVMLGQRHREEFTDCFSSKLRVTSIPPFPGQHCFKSSIMEYFIHKCYSYIPTLLWQDKC